MEIAQQKEREGKIDEASDYFYRALEISTDLYPPLISKLKELNIQFLVSPYESDAQLGFLFRNNYIDLVITEDGDSLVYGCRRVLFKLDKGVGEEIDMSRLSRCTKLNFCDWTHDMFTYLCVLSGCDYLPSLHGIGFVRAYQAVSRGRTPAGIFEYLRGVTTVPIEYENGFARAVFTFRHQTVFDPQRRATVPLLPLPASLQSQPPAYLGPLLPCELAERIAAGEVDAVTHREIRERMEEENERGNELRNEFRNELGNEYRNELGNEYRNELGNELGNEYRNEYGNELGVQSGREAESPENRQIGESVGSIGSIGSIGSEQRFTSPFVSVSFRALIERPSERGLPRRGDLSHLDFASGSAVKRALVLESPPHKRPAVQRIGPSPVTARCVNAFLDQFRRNLSQQ